MPEVDGFDEFYRGSRQRLLGFVYALTGNLAEAQDAVQEAYIRAWQRWSTVAGYDDPEAWVRVVASRIAVSRWRSLRSRARAYLRHGVDDSTPAPSTDTVAVVAALRQLPEEQRTALALYYLLGMPVTEVARETAAPVGTVKARLSRGRTALAGLLAVSDLEEAADA
ncbi:SigE family RNA polymerase sigma factor [Micromonospora carbonacea]|uniref:RNA polymerase sigma-70 factor, ECF subfamily n=1 Tax=Micromonospora carbonacea TaxID=47853 RepID=A0A1C5A6W2_9ACTN|nr:MULTISPECIES: SigE family RNA polymerase sigma factor [Micromonospora]MBB5828776.1 RNA polymerase sigma-70 factor (ECF subfamily) [Micromonospora carbonacea]MDG4817321.1 SigE family RNA polymerase sigma factor [Micromonospora sp. WMMD956]QLD23665.1 SigE family RNA polymerase sigma factor [Micromonospora carbonacea]WFE59883.1 SigE family RNA polymerase sigma factor [Micromonospora sp. WMMD712]SCF40927.1 RNA polymerase sigma-70 factor, ECF subfamily [Micromonospora carbonacea]